MIEFDTFYKEYQENNRALNEKIDINHREIMPKIDDLCGRMTKIETKWEDNEKAQAVSAVNKKEVKNSRYNNIFVGTGVTATIFGFIEVLKGYFGH